MNDDLKAIRELIKEAAAPDCLFCQPTYRDTHMPRCPVPSAEAALERLEQVKSVYNQLDFKAGYAVACEQAAKIAHDVYEELLMGMAPGATQRTALNIEARIEAMTPEGGDE